MKKNRETRKNEHAAARQEKKDQRMKHPKGTSSYAKKKKNGANPSSPLYKEPEPPQQAQSSPLRRSQKSVGSGSTSKGISFTNIYG